MAWKFARVAIPRIVKLQFLDSQRCNSLNSRNRRKRMQHCTVSDSKICNFAFPGTRKCNFAFVHIPHHANLHFLELRTPYSRLPTINKLRQLISLAFILKLIDCDEFSLVMYWFSYLPPAGPYAVCGWPAGHRHGGSPGRPPVKGLIPIYFKRLPAS